MCRRVPGLARSRHADDARAAVARPASRGRAGRRGHRVDRCARGGAWADLAAVPRRRAHRVDLRARLARYAAPGARVRTQAPPGALDRAHAPQHDRAAPATAHELESTGPPPVMLRGARIERAERPLPFVDRELVGCVVVIRPVRGARAVPPDQLVLHVRLPVMGTTLRARNANVCSVSYR